MKISFHVIQKVSYHRLTLSLEEELVIKKYISILALLFVILCLQTSALTACGQKENAGNPVNIENPKSSENPGPSDGPKYSYEDFQALEFDTYCPYDEEYLKTLRDTYDLDSLTAGCETEFEKVQKVTEWVTNLWDHNGWNIPPKGDPLSILNDVTKEGAQYRCVEYGTVIFGCLNALDIPARTIGLKTEDVETRELGAGHVATEAFLKDFEKWVLIDGQWGTIPMSGDTPLNAVELCEALWRPEPSPETEESRDPVEFLSFREEGSDGYAEWIKEYLFYMNTTYYKKSKNGYRSYSMMLTPIGSKSPKIFQIKYPLKMDNYTHSVVRFYALPQSNS